MHAAAQGTQSNAALRADVAKHLPSRPVQLFIDGEWRPPIDGGTFEAVSPSVGGVVGLVSEAGRQEAAQAGRAAAMAFDAWSRRTPFDRAAVLHQIGDRIKEQREELVVLLALDQGRPVVEGYAEVDQVARYFHIAADDAVRLEGSIPASADPRKHVLLKRRPVGPIGVITPWNWPYQIAADSIAPALASGNTVVWTPAPNAALCSAAMAKAIAECDLPKGVFNFVTGPGPVVGDEIAGHPDLAMVVFVGSPETGRQVASRAAGKRQLLELGNNGPMVIMEGADLTSAVEATIKGCFLGAGQSCAAAGRLLVHEPAREEFVARLAEAVEAVRLGDPLARDTTMGPLNNEGVAAKMDRHVADARARGAVLVTGGARRSDMPTPLYWEPTLLDQVPADALTAHEETFGPIAPVIGVSSLSEAIAVTNQLRYGLMAAIFTPNVMDGLDFAASVRAGNVNINETSNYFERHLPFGGGGGSDSGFGRTGGRHIFDEMTELQTITITP